MKNTMRVTMPDGTRWDVPVAVIARNRAERYKGEFDNDVERSLAEDTLPLFTADEYEIQNWAENNMNWRDVMHFARAVRREQDPDHQDGWVNGDKEFIDLPVTP